jgi:hypothetical protein
MHKTKIKTFSLENFEPKVLEVPKKKYKVKFFSTRGSNRARVSFLNYCNRQGEDRSFQRISEVPINMKENPFFRQSPVVLRLVSNSRELVSPFTSMSPKSEKSSFWAPAVVSISKLPSLQPRPKTRLKLLKLKKSEKL